jgi:16S rRNA (guanine527-N7)-methyltransferase
LNAGVSGRDQATEDLLAPLVAEQRQQLEQYIDLLLRATADFNLTAIRDREEAWNRHILESLRLLPLLGEGQRLIDVGTGGGLPGMVLAIARPDLAVTLLEATTKKAHFLERTAKTLGLSNVNVTTERAEDAAANGAPLRQTFDIVTARAVAPLRVLLELTIPFLKPSGLFVAVKGEKANDELTEAQKAMTTLAVSLEASHRHPTATVLLLRKNGPTPAKYPRRSGEPKRNPL